MMTEERDNHPANDDSTVDALRERMHVYESFDQVIADNMARAKSFLNEAAELRERVTREVAEARASLESELAERRAALETEIAQARERLEAQRSQLATVAQSILSQIHVPGAGSSEPVSQPLVTSEAVPAAPAIASPPSVGEPDVPADEPEADALLTTTAEPEPAPVNPTIAEESAPVSGEGTFAAPSETEATPAVEPEAVIKSEPVDQPVRTTIIVHGIHRPATATGLQRYLLAQQGVTGVEPREFAEGILRLQVFAMVPIDESLFTGWDDGEGMTLVQRVPQTVEVILPSAG